MAVRTNASGDSLSRTTGLPAITLFTIMGWFRYVTDLNAYGCFISFGDASGTQYMTLGLSFDGTTLFIYDGAGETTGSALTLGNLYHLAFVGNGTALTGYLNGVSDITETRAAGVAAEKLWLMNDNGSEYIDGSFESVKIYDAALTASEIVMEMRSVKPVRTAGLNSWFPGTDAPTAHIDRSGNARYLTPAGTLKTEAFLLRKPRPRGLLFLPGGKIKKAASGIAFDAASNSSVQTSVSTYNWSHTCTGTNRYLAVDVSLLSAGNTVVSITYNGVALSPIANAAISTITSLGRVECWGLANPASGSNTIAVTLSGSILSISTAVSYTNVQQTSPTESGNAAQATNIGAADATVTITPVADKTWIHAAVATDDKSITANQTTRNNVTTGASPGGSGADEDTGPISPAAGTAVSYTDIGAAATWAIAGYAIRPVGAANLSTGVNLLTLLGCGA